MHRRKAHFHFSHVFLFISEKTDRQALLFTQYLNSDISHLSIDINCMFVTLMVLEIYSFSHKYAECPKVDHEHS